ncbi:MAG: hypothetical protein JNK12_10095 [Acidimicrobiales bacterium]|nr:hypothetical protein [Acidimicrobiales bacterium]
MSTRQQVLVLYLASSALDGAVVGWARYDGDQPGPTPPVADKPSAPYATGVDALRDGWRLFQASPLQPPAPGAERRTSYLQHEFLFERLVEV